jgi:hypothetical protein
MKSHRFPATAFAAVLVALAACGGEKSPKSAADSTRDIALTPQPTPPAQPQLRDVPATPTKSATPQKTTTKTAAKTAPANPPASPPASAPPSAPPPAPEGAKFGVIPVGTSLGLRTTAKLCTNTAKVGDHVTTTIAETVSGSSGVSIPAGSTATLEVVASQYGQNDKNKVKLTFAPVSVEVGGQTYPVSGDVTQPDLTKVRRQSTGQQVGKVATGAAIGAVLGKVLGKSNTATAAGAAVGAAGGAAAAAGTADYDGCVADQQRLAVTLTQALRIRAS